MSSDNLFPHSQIVSFSGGKDSTAMLHMMIERKEPIEAVVFFDTGWEFPEMQEHLRSVEKMTGIEIVRLQPVYGVSFWDRVRNDYGWPCGKNRWCTKEKTTAIDRFAKQYVNPIQCIGFAADEQRTLHDDKRYPLIEWGVTEEEALRYCGSLGYTWGGLYTHFDRVSCFCCPQKNLNELRVLRRQFPALWETMLAADLTRPAKNNGFKCGQTVHDLDARFAFEETLSSIGVPASLQQRWSTKWRECAAVNT